MFPNKNAVIQEGFRHVRWDATMHSCMSLLVIIRLALLLTAHLTALANSAENPVVLGSTLRQGSLCPADDMATFTCSAVGTDLVWLVDGRTMAYNANARVGTLRSNALSDQTAILMRVDTIGGRVANRMSVLTITALPSATDLTIVKCHNGSVHFGREIRFLRTAGSPLDTPVIDHLYPISSTNIHLNWTVPNLDEAIYTINHFFVKVDNKQPVLEKKSSIVLYVEQLDANHTLQIWAIDNCNTTGELGYKNFSGGDPDIACPSPITPGYEATMLATDNSAYMPAHAFGSKFRAYQKGFQSRASKLMCAVVLILHFILLC